MRKQKMTSIEFMKWQGYGTKKRLADIERFEKKLKTKKYQPLAKILDNNIRPNFYCFLLYYDKVPTARYKKTHKNILIEGKPYKFVYINDIIKKTKIHYSTGEYKKISNSKRSLVYKIKYICTTGVN